MSRRTGLRVAAVILCAAAVGTATVVALANPERRVEVVRLGGGFLGVVLEDVGKDDVARLKLSEERGAVVKELEADSPAQKAGLKGGDVILRYQGESVHSVAQLVRLVRETPPGRTVAIEISRNGAPVKLSATLEERRGGRLLLRDLDIDVPVPPLPPEPPEPPGERRRGRELFRELFRHEGLGGPRKLGIEYMEISDQLARHFRLPEGRGVLVSSVDEDGPAAKAGMKAGDVIVKLSGKAVGDADDLRRAVARAEPAEEVTITVYRDGKPLDLKVQLAGRPTPRRSGDTT